jgi:hypothetical protein
MLIITMVQNAASCRCVCSEAEMMCLAVMTSCEAGAGSRLGTRQQALVTLCCTEIIFDHFPVLRIAVHQPGHRHFAYICHEIFS